MYCKKKKKKVPKQQKDNLSICIVTKQNLHYVQYVCKLVENVLLPDPKPITPIWSLISSVISQSSSRFLMEINPIFLNCSKLSFVVIVHSTAHSTDVEV